MSEDDDGALSDISTPSGASDAVTRQDILPSLVQLELSPHPNPRFNGPLNINTEISTIVSSSLIVTENITEQFAQACAGKSKLPLGTRLETGQLIKDEWFTLFESVGALEIMDKKMDSGYLELNETLEDSYDIQRQLSAGEVISVMDELLCHEAAWSTGHPLSQTLFTSIYLDNLLWPTPKNVEAARFGCDSPRLPEEGNELVNVVLRAYCIALIKTCGVVHTTILSQCFHEVKLSVTSLRVFLILEKEEDFVSQLYNRDFLPWLSLDDCLAILDEAEVWVSKAYKKKKGTKQTSKTQTQEALLSRLRFRKELLSALQSLSGDQDMGLDNRLESCAILLEQLSTTAKLGTPVPESFSAKIQRRLASTVPPRSIVKTEFESALSYFSQLLKDGRAVLKISYCPKASDLMLTVPYFVARRPHPSVFIRAILQYIIFDRLPSWRRVSTKEMIFEELENLVIPGTVFTDRANDEVELPSDPRYGIATTMEAVLQKVSQFYTDLLRCLCQNRSRVRRMLSHLIKDWDTVVEEMSSFDASLARFASQLPINPEADKSLGTKFPEPLQVWIQYRLRGQMLLLIQLGFELDVYALHELGAMYSYLLDTLSDQLGLMGAITEDIVEWSNHLRMPKSKGQINYSAAFHYIQCTKLNGQSQLALALFNLYTVLSRQGLIKPIESPYSSDSLRYELRTKPFQNAVAFQPTFEHHVELVEQANDSTEELLLVGAESIKLAKTFFSNLKPVDHLVTGDLNKSLRVCIATNVALAMASAMVESGSTEGWRVELPPPAGDGVLPEGVWHEWWIVPKIIRPRSST
ncbi:MAG: hypothetical protein M1814_000029 [Vezdaea aestivalis]|nr:MAG: hypothetical protein M1814_000029 [Vezdaea aestivalis]